GWAAAIAEHAALDAELLERAREVVDRALPHARIAVDRDRTVCEARRGGQEAGGGARVSGEQRSARGAQPTAATLDSPGAAARLDRAAEREQRCDHHVGIVARERARELARALGERGHEQRAVRDALRTRNTHARIERTARLDAQRVGQVEHAASRLPHYHPT